MKVFPSLEWKRYIGFGVVFEAIRSAWLQLTSVVTLSILELTLSIINIHRGKPFKTNSKKGFITVGTEMTNFSHLVIWELLQGPFESFSKETPKDLLHF